MGLSLLFSAKIKLDLFRYAKTGVGKFFPKKHTWLYEGNWGGAVGKERESCADFLPPLQKGVFSTPSYMISFPISFTLLAYDSKMHQESTSVQTWY